MGLPPIKVGSRKNEGQELLALVWQKRTISQADDLCKLTRIKRYIPGYWRAAGVSMTRWREPGRAKDLWGLTFYEKWMWITSPSWTT
jgi:hypothetical protein